VVGHQYEFLETGTPVFGAFDQVGEQELDDDQACNQPVQDLRDPGIAGVGAVAVYAVCYGPVPPDKVELRLVY